MPAPMASSETKANVRHVLLSKKNRQICGGKAKKRRKNGALETVNSAISDLILIVVRDFLW